MKGSSRTHSDFCAVPGRGGDTPVNTRIDYLYRDASNYKLYGSVIIPREITRQQIQEIMKYCLPFDGETRQFIPELVGFPKLEFDCPNEDDHLFCEIRPESFSPTDQEPTLCVSPKDLVEKFQIASQSATMKFYSEWC